MRSKNAVLKDISYDYRRVRPKKNWPPNSQLRQFLQNLEAICDLNSFVPGYIYVIYLGKSYMIRDIKRLNKEFLFPKDVEAGVRAIVFFKRNRSSQEDNNKEISFFLQERGLFNQKIVEILDFVTCYNYRCRSLRKKTKN